ncbi:phage regulatory protein/antirepressor Ant [Aquabacter sp. CN5-332]|uniref:Rha family transcriptional regulator n=1 Tax=Aquabacter sp. CN5-332 TaxID=3156608 RepID=UPI0032B3A3FE
MTNEDMLPLDAARNPIVEVRNGEALTNSRDVAAYFEKEHRDVLRAVDNLLQQEPNLALRNFTHAPYRLHSTGDQLHRSFDMTRDGFTLLAMGFTGPKALKWKLRYIEAFNLMEGELRARPAVDPAKVLNDPAAMRGLLLSYTEKVLELEAKVAEQKDDVAALDRIAKSEGSLCVTDAAKALQVRPSDLFAYLRSHNWIYRRAGTAHDIGYQNRVNSGDLEHKVTTVLRADGSDKVTEQVRVTPQGLAKLAKLMSPAIKAA